MSTTTALYVYDKVPIPCIHYNDSIHYYITFSIYEIILRARTKALLVFVCLSIQELLSFHSLQEYGGAVWYSFAA